MYQHDHSPTLPYPTGPSPWLPQLEGLALTSTSFSFMQRGPAWLIDPGRCTDGREGEGRDRGGHGPQPGPAQDVRSAVAKAGSELPPQGLGPKT